MRTRSIKKPLSILATLFTLSMYPAIPAIRLMSSRPLSPERLEQELYEERQKLSLEGKIIHIRYDPNDEMANGSILAYAQKIDENKYNIVLGKNGLNVGSLRHELYHIADGHFETKNYSLMKYYFILEPQANYYAAFGWKF